MSKENNYTNITSAFLTRGQPETMVEVAPKVVGESGKSRKIQKIQDFLYIFDIIFDPKISKVPVLGAGFRQLPDVGLIFRVAESIRLGFLHRVGSRGFFSGAS